MSRVQNLLPTAAPTRPRAGTPSTARSDFDAVLARTLPDRPRDPAGPTPRPPDRSARIDHRPRPDHARPEQPGTRARSGARPGPTDGSIGDPAGTRGHQNANPSDLDPAPDRTVNGTVTPKRSTPPATAPGTHETIGPTSEDTDAEEPRPGGTDLGAESVAGFTVDRQLAPAVVTAAPTALTPATAPEPEAGTLSAAVVNRDPAIITTVPIVSEAAPIGATAPEEAGEIAPATVVSGVSAASPRTIGPADPGTTQPATTQPATAPPATAESALTVPATATAATRTANAEPLGATRATTEAAPPTPLVPPAAGANPGAVIGNGIAAAPSGPTAAALAGASDATIAGQNGAPAPTPAPIGPVPLTPAVEPVAAALAGAYGPAAPSAPLVTGPSGAPVSEPGSSEGSVTTVGGLPVGADAPIGLGADESTGANDSDRSDRSGTGSIPAADGSTAPADGSSDAAGSLPLATTAAGTTPVPGTTGIPVTGINGVTGINPMTGATSAEAPEPTVRAAEITDQVTAHVNRQLQNVRTLRDGTHHTVLKISPEHLGEVTITIDVRAGGVRLELSAAGPALAALQSDLGRLRDDLAGSGLDLGAVTLSSQDAGPSGNGQARDRWQPPAPSGGELAGDGTPLSAALPEDQFARSDTSGSGDGGLDVLA